MSTETLLNIKFDSEDKGDFDEVERLEWWVSNREWFSARGYSLYRQLSYDEDDDPQVYYPINPVFCSQQHPYAQYHGGNYDTPNARYPELAEALNDSKSRHIAIKLVKIASSEYRMLQYLKQQSSLVEAEDFPCVMPVLDMLECGSHCFVVMPRWGIHSQIPKFGTMREILESIRALLKATAFLHKNLIAHRDITSGNVYVNHIAYTRDLYYNPLRSGLRRQGQLSYALFDFDLSVMFPPVSTPEERRLPYRMSWDGGPFTPPYDTAQGEEDYDPFAYDIASLGIMLCHCFQEFVPLVPMLAPLLDNMVTWRLSHRFTAPEALEFFEMMYAQLTPWQLEAYPSTGFSGTWEECDRWTGLPQDFIETWGVFRDPKPPLNVTVLRKLCEREWPHAVGLWSRRLLRSTRQLWRRVVFGNPL